MPGSNCSSPAQDNLQQLRASELLLGTLPAIYGATLQPGCWMRIMEATAPLIGTGKVMFAQVDRLCPSESLTEAIGLAPEHLQALKDRDLDQDFIWKSCLSLKTGTVFRSTELQPTDVLHTGPLYDHIGKPAGLEYVLGVILENTPAFFSNLAFMKAGEDFSDAARDVLRGLVPHLQIALQVSRRVALGDAGRSEALLSFDRARQPMVVLDRSGYVIYSNQSASDFLKGAACMSLKFGRFHFDDIAVQGEFERVVHLALVGQNADIAPAPRAIRVPRPDGAAPCGLSVVAVQRSVDRALLPDGAGCMVLIHDATGLSPLPLQRLSWLYGLTPAEVRICESLYQVGSVDSVAETLHLTRNTVRSHLKTIFSKFGVATQGQLMQHLANSVRLTEGGQAERQVN